MAEKRSLSSIGLLWIAIAIALIFPIHVIKLPQKGQASAAPLASFDKCPGLPPATGTVIHVSTVSELQNAVATLKSNTTILLADGVYDLSQTLVIDGGLSDVSIRGASGNRQAVILRGKGMANASYGNTPHGFLIRNSKNLLIADLTIRDFYYHDIQIQGEQDAQAVHLYNLELLDAGEQLVKVSAAGPPAPFSDDGIVECSYLAYTDRARSWYTNAVDVIGGARWIIRDNVIENIRAPQGQLAGPAVLLWRNTVDSVVERNLFIECDRAIALGLSKPSKARDNEQVYDNQRSIVRNNMIYRAGSGDVGIHAWYAKDFKIYHNTILLNGTFPYGAIDYRFSVSTGEIAYNLTDAPIWRRDGATASLQGNITEAKLSWFVDPANHDLHLAAEATAAIDAAKPLSEVIEDFDGESRPMGTAPDIGADELADPSDFPIFEDVPFSHWANGYIEELYRKGYVEGCSSSPRRYCPDLRLNRGEAAVFVVRGLHPDLPGYMPPPPTVQYYDDVLVGEGEDWYGKWVTELKEQGFTEGCSKEPPLYCPLLGHRRAEATVFFWRMLNGPDAEPPETSEQIFNDVPPVDGSGNPIWYHKWVTAAYHAGIIQACQTDMVNMLFRPEEDITRDEAACMMFMALGLATP